MSTISENTGEAMEMWPEYVDRAFRVFYYGGQHEREIETFVQRWGGLDIETFIHVLESGTSQEKAIALLAIGYSGVSQAREILLPFLNSTEPMERWASALVLGEMKEERALPVLIQLLDEFLPPRINIFEIEGGVYLSWHIRVATLLGNWERGELAPILRQALKKSWDIEQAEESAFKNAWHPYQDALVYALGRVGASGALSGISLPMSRIQLWMVMLSFGSLHARKVYGDLLTEIQINETLKREVAQILEQDFGLAKEEQISYIEHYADDFFARMSENAMSR